MTSKPIIAALIISLSLVIISCGTEAIKSNWADELIEADWRRSQIFYEDQKISIAALNNKEELQVFIASADRARIMQFLSQGFTVWIQKGTDNNDLLGIQYPVKKLGNDPQKLMIENRDAKADPNKLISKMIDQQNEFLLVNDEDYPLGAYPIKNKLGVEPKIKLEMGQLVYSIKLPITNNNPEIFDISYIPGEKINISFEMEVPDRENMGRGGRGSGMRNGRPSGGRMGGGTRGGIMMRNRPEPIDLNLEIMLADKL